MRAVDTFLHAAVARDFEHAAELWDGRDADDVAGFCFSGCRGNRVVASSPGDAPTAMKVFVQSGPDTLALTAHQRRGQWRIVSGIPDKMRRNQPEQSAGLNQLTAAVTARGGRLVLGWDGAVEIIDWRGSTWLRHPSIRKAVNSWQNGWIHGDGAFTSVSDPTLRCPYPTRGDDGSPLTAVGIGRVEGRLVAQVSKASGGESFIVDCATGDFVDRPLIYSRGGSSAFRLRLEAGMTVLSLKADSIGNVVIERQDGVRISEDRATAVRLAPNGSSLAYIDRTSGTRGVESRFSSRRLVLRDTATGLLLGDWLFDQPLIDEVLWNGEWIVVTTDGQVGERSLPPLMIAIQPRTGVQLTARTTALALALD
ncbi:MAG: hypothetical protein HKN03_10000 [Acidimicrobiales bacterium]|nr:hypothetical protein [Acidimicrobiales bacterium]